MGDLNGRKTPPEHDEWEAIWDALDKAKKSWVIAGPFHAIVTNWKGLLAIGGVIIAINSPEVIAALRALIGK